jgi:hypothetical protein
VQLLLPSALENDPGGQRLQGWSGAGLKLPGLQVTVSAVQLTAPAFDVVPVGHCWHDAAPTMLE